MIFNQVLEEDREYIPVQVNLGKPWSFGNVERYGPL